MRFAHAWLLILFLEGLTQLVLIFRVSCDGLSVRFAARFGLSDVL